MIMMIIIVIMIIVIVVRTITINSFVVLALWLKCIGTVVKVRVPLQGITTHHLSTITRHQLTNHHHPHGRLTGPRISETDI